MFFLETTAKKFADVPSETTSGLESLQLPDNVQQNKYITCLDADRPGIRFKAVNGRMCEYAVRMCERQHRLRMVLELPE